MSNIDELKQEATDLGVSFSPNIGAAKLKEKIEAKYASQETNEKAIEEAITAKEAEELEGVALVSAMEKKAIAKSRTIKERAREAERKARVTHVIEIVDNDPRVNAHTTTCSPSCGNEYFDLGTRVLPLNTPVEVEQGFINTLKELTFSFHQLDQKKGTSVQMNRKRYSISYVQEPTK